MIVVSLSPVVVSVGPFAVRWFGLLALVGLGLGAWSVVRQTRRQAIPARVTLDALAWALPAGVIFARVVHVLGWWDYYLAHAADVTRLSLEDGLSVWGGLVGGGLVAAARLGRDPGRRRRVLDAAAPAAALGIGIGRLGEFLDGAGQGLPSTLPWATRYTSPLASVPDFGVPRHPAQLYDAGVCLALLFVLRSAALARLSSGLRLAAFCVVYGIARLGLGQVRLDPPFLFGVPIEHLLAGGCVIWGAWYATRQVRRRHARMTPPDALPRADSSLAA